MLESQRATALLDEWKRSEARIDAIKKELASILGVSATASAHVASTKGQTQLPLVDDNDGRHAPVAPGTKGRATIEAMHSLGGKAKAGQVKDVLLAQGLVTDDPKGMKSIRSYFNYLKKKSYIVSVKGHAGTWELTPLALSVLGGAP